MEDIEIKNITRRLSTLLHDLGGEAWYYKGLIYFRIKTTKGDLFPCDVRRVLGASQMSIDGFFHTLLTLSSSTLLEATEYEYVFPHVPNLVCHSLPNRSRFN